MRCCHSRGGAFGVAQQDAGVGSRFASAHCATAVAQPCLPARRQCITAAPYADLAAFGQGIGQQRREWRLHAPRALQCIQPVLGGGRRIAVHAQTRHRRGTRLWSNRYRLRAPLHLARQLQAGAIQTGQGIGNVHGQCGARGQLCIQLTQQAGQRCAGCRRCLIDGGKAGCQPTPVARFGGAAQCGRVQSGSHYRPGSGDRGRADQRRSCQQQGQCGQQQQAHQQQRPIIEADALARTDLCTQPAQRGEIQRRIRMAPGEVDQQRQQPCGERGQAQREQQDHAPPPRPNSACSG